MNWSEKLINPFTLPVFFFAGTIGMGTVLLLQPFSLAHDQISLIDALFTATSATCVTGLIVVDTGSFFSPAGQIVILTLIQLGGLGIMTYTTLVFYLWRRRVPLTDRISVGQSLLKDPSFHLGKFVQRVVVLSLGIEAVGCLALILIDAKVFDVFSALFHAVSAFCNAGFSLYSTSLNSWSDNGLINGVFLVLIILGGLGFSVLMELIPGAKALVLGRRNKGQRMVSWHTRTVLTTSFFLVTVGALWIILAENVGQERALFSHYNVLTGIFQSVTCRTAGFHTLDVSSMTNLSLILMILLMFIGGSPGSCAGGVKTTTFRALVAFGTSQIMGRRQSVLGRFALDAETQNKALTLAIFGFLIIFLGTVLLTVTEGKNFPGPQNRGQFLEILFEVVSAFGTVGLSMGLTAKLSEPGKVVIMIIMFLGRLGPILFLSVLQSWQTRERFGWPEETMLIG